MKSITTIISLTLLLSACQVQDTTVPFDQLIGKWKRTNDQPGIQTYENWEQKSQDLYYGYGYTVKGSDTISAEHMLIRKQQDNWIFAVKTSSQEDTIYFTETSIQLKSFIFEWPEHDFPKKIHYQFTDNGIQAQISNESLNIEYIFERVQ